MKKFLALMLLLCAGISYGAASSSSQVEESREIAELRDPVQRVIDALHRHQYKSLQVDFADYLEEVADKLPEDKIDHFIRILLSLGEARNKDDAQKVIEVNEIKEALGLLKIHSTIAPSSLPIEQISAATVPNEVGLWKCTTKFATTFCFAAVTGFAASKAVQYYNASKK